MLQGGEAEYIFLGDGIHDVLKREFFFSVENLVREDGRLARHDVLCEFSLQCSARNFGFYAAYLAAVADDVIVVGSHVAKFARIARLAVIEFAVDDDSDSQSPAHVHENHIFHSLAASLDEFCEGHASRIILYADWKLDEFRQLVCQGFI